MGIPKVTLFGSCWAEVCDVKCGKMYQIYFQILNNSKKTDRQVVFLLCKKSQAKYTMRLKHSQPPNELGDDSSPLSDGLKKNFGQILRVRMRVGLGCARRRPRRRVGFDSFVTYKVPLSTPQRLWIISSLHVFWHLRRCCEVEHKILNLLFNTFVCVLLKGDLPQSNA